MCGSLGACSTLLSLLPFDLMMAALVLLLCGLNCGCATHCCRARSSWGSGLWHDIVCEVSCAALLPYVCDLDELHHVPSRPQNLGQLETRARAVVAVHATIMGKDNNVAARALVQPQLSMGRQAVHAASDSANEAVQQLPRPASGRAAASKAMLAGAASTTMTANSKGKNDHGTGCEGEEEESDDDSDDGCVPLTREQLQAKLGYHM